MNLKWILKMLQTKVSSFVFHINVFLNIALLGSTDFVLVSFVQDILHIPMD